MITIEHCTTRKGLKYYACVQLQHDTNAFMYALGLEPPNYPMPAIPVSIGLWPDAIGLVTVYDDLTYDLHALWLKD